MAKLRYERACKWVLTGIRPFVVVQRVGAAGVVVGQRSVVVVILVTLL